MRAIATLTFFFLCLGNTIFILVIGLIWIGSASESLKGASIKLIFDYVYNCIAYSLGFDSLYYAIGTN